MVQMEALAAKACEGSSSKDPYYEVINKLEHSGRRRLYGQGVTNSVLKNAKKSSFIFPQKFTQCIQDDVIMQLVFLSLVLLTMCTLQSFLSDLGASLSVMLFSVYERLHLGELIPAQVTLQLADRSVRFPRGKIEDVPSRMGKHLFPVDLIVLEIDEDESTPIILGRPILGTANYCEDWEDIFQD